MHAPVNMKTDMAIRAANVTLSLGSNDAAVSILRGVDLEVPYDSSVALLGPSGSGKSSLMAVLAGLEQATGGTVLVDGLDFTKLDEDALARARRGRIGIVLQAFHLLPTMTALENVAIPMELAGMDDPFGRAKAELEAVGLGHRLTHYPSQLSGGEQQRVAIARAVANAPDILLADEPTGNLDPETAKIVFDALSRIVRGTGTAALIVTHNQLLAEQMDDILTISQGRIVRSGT